MRTSSRLRISHMRIQLGISSKQSKWLAEALDYMEGGGKLEANS
jgi:hypothetical protein